MNTTLVATFDDRTTALNARDRLLAEGFDESEISLHDVGTAAATGTTTTTTGTSTAGEDGGIAAWFRSLFGLDDADDDVRLHAEAARRGATTLAVRTDDETRSERAADLLHACGAVDLDSRAAAWRQEGWTGTAAAAAMGTTPLSGTSNARLADGDRTIPVVEEQLAVGKRVVRRGGVRLYTRIVERPVEASVQLREEHAEISRRAVDRPATEADLAAMRDATIEVQETVEEPVVAKSAHVVEEVDVGRRVEERTETVRDTVRRTEVDVDKIDANARESEHAMASRSRTTGTDAGTRDPDALRGTTRDADGGTTGRSRS